MALGINALKGRVSVEDFYDFDHMGSWIRVISMQQYLDKRCAAVARLPTHRIINNISICILTNHELLRLYNVMVPMCNI